MKCSEDKGFWVARDLDGTLCLFLGEPILDDLVKRYLSPDDDNSILLLDESMFPEVTWEDLEPTPVELMTVEEIEKIILKQIDVWMKIQVSG